MNAYGHSKAAGELSTISANPHNLAVRISSVFGSAGSSGKGGNFVETILKKARAGEPLNVVGDMYMSPTYTVDAAFKIMRLVDASYSGVVNASNNGSASWFTFAKKILELAKIETSITATVSDSSQPLKRPMNSTLDTSMVNLIIGLNPSWEDALYRYLSEKGHVK